VNRNNRQSKRAEITRVSVLSLLFCILPIPINAQCLINPSFEQIDKHGNPIGWNILTDLDEASYGKPDFKFQFSEIQPVVTTPGRGGKGHALAFPKTGTWRCEVSEHDRGRIRGEISAKPGSRRGKAAVYHVVTLPPGKYRFGAYLRTADGDCWSGAFSLGYSLDGTTKYAHHDSTGIQWTQHNLAMRGDPNGDYREWGEWQRRETDAFEIKKKTRVSLWIRFNYVNQHATNVRWEIDDATIERIEPEPIQLSNIRHYSTDPPSFGDFTDFQLDLKIEPKPEWRELEVRFRETDEDALVLTLTHEGTITLQSLVAGTIHTAQVTLEPEPDFKLSMFARGQYLRVNLPGHGGFETRIIGPRGLRMTHRVEPLGSARISPWFKATRPSLYNIAVPASGGFQKIYDPSPDPSEPWYINDHCFIQDTKNLWHMFGITHPEPAHPTDEDFFAHATAHTLLQTPWRKQPHVGHVNEDAGETHVWAPHVIYKDKTYYMFYCGGGNDGDAYQINLRTSKDLVGWQWHDGNPLFTDIGNARDPMVLRLKDGTYLMYYTRPACLDEPFSGVAVRESKDLLHWSEPTMALVTHRKERFGRKTESPFVFRHNEAFYLSATGLSGGYRDTRVWRSLNPRHFNADHLVARIDAHAPEWVATKPNEAPTYLTHCGWKQGGLYIAPVRWETVQWDPFGLLVIHLKPNQLPARIEVRRKPKEREPYRTFSAAERTTCHALPPGRYHVSVRPASDATIGPVPIEIIADERTRVNPEP